MIKLQPEVGTAMVGFMFFRLSFKKPEENSNFSQLEVDTLIWVKSFYLKLTINKDAEDKSHYVSSSSGMDTLINERWHLKKKKSKSEERQELKDKVD